jgi:hypothetical protein
MNTIPCQLWCEIAEYLEAKDAISFGLTCQQYYNVFKLPRFVFAFPEITGKDDANYQSFFYMPQIWHKIYYISCDCNTLKFIISDVTFAKLKHRLRVLKIVVNLPLTYDIIGRNKNIKLNIVEKVICVIPEQEGSPGFEFLKKPLDDMIRHEISTTVRTEWISTIPKRLISSIFN